MASSIATSRGSGAERRRGPAREWSAHDMADRTGHRGFWRTCRSLGTFGARSLTLVLSFHADVLLIRPAPHVAGRALTSHFGVAQPMRGPVGLGAAGWRRSADHDRRSLRERAPKRRHAGNHAARRSEAE